MTFQLISPAVLQAITLSEAKAHLRVTASEEDEFITGLIKSAMQLVESETGLSLITQTYRLWVDDLPQDHVVLLPRNPARNIVQIVWYDRQGTPVILPGSAYFFNSITRPARLKFDRAACPAGPCNGIEVDFDAGFGEAGVDVPDLIKRALKILIAHWYEFRGAYAPSDQPISIPEAYTHLIRHYRQVRLL